MYECSEEEVERFGKEGGAFLIKNGIVDTDNLEEIRQFKKENEEEEEIEKIEGKESFNIIKESERSDKKMDYYEYADSADNADSRELLIDEIQEFYGNELDSDFEKALKKIPEKMLTGLKAAFKVLNENSAILEDYPDLKTAMKYIGKFVGYPYPYPYPSGKGPGKYPYPGGKVKKSGEPILWSDMLSQMFPDDDEDEDEFEKSDEKPTREKPWPTFAKEFKKNAREIKKNRDILEQHFFNPYDRMA